MRPLNAVHGMIGFNEPPLPVCITLMKVCRGYATPDSWRVRLALNAERDPRPTSLPPPNSPGLRGASQAV